MALRLTKPFQPLTVENARALPGQLGIYELADAETLPGFRADCLNETEASRRRLEAAIPAAPPRLGISWREPSAPGEGLVVASVAVVHAKPVIFNRHNANTETVSAPSEATSTC